MIKKFEEFVNEMYSPYEQRMQNRAKAIREFVDYLMGLGVGDQDCKANAVFELCKNFWKYDPENGNAFAFCSQIAYFGIAGTWRILKPKKYDGTISLTCFDSNNNNFEMYNI